MFPLEPIAIFNGDQKMTSDTGDQIRFWAHHHLARQYYQDHNLLSFNQFDLVDWKYLQGTLHSLARLLQLWTAKHVLGIAGTMKFLAYQDNRCPLCPSCGTSVKTCKHVAQCPESGRMEAFSQSSGEVEKWMLAQHTHPDLASLLLAYLRGRGSTTSLECMNYLNLPPIYRDYAASQDVIGWDGFVTGWVLAKLLLLHSSLSHENSWSGSATRWISGLITQLLLVMHTQWIYRCVLVHNCTTGTLILAHKEELLSRFRSNWTLGQMASMNRIGSC